MTNASPPLSGLKAVQALIGKGTAPEAAAAEALAVAINGGQASTDALEAVENLDSDDVLRMVREAAAFKIADATDASRWLRKRFGGR